MSRGAPREVRRLCRRLQPLLREKEARKEFIEQCRIHHRQQMHRSFPRKGRPSSSVRLTAYVALTALRWLEEKNSGELCAFVPSWDDLKMMGKCLIRSKGYVAILADKVGGAIGHDQIYSYFSMGRRRPDGEFVLRLVNFVALLRAISVDPSLGPHFRKLRAWRNIETLFRIQEQRRQERMRQLQRRMGIRIKTPLLQHGQTPTNVLRFKGKRTSLLGVLLGVGPKTDPLKVTSL